MTRTKQFLLLLFCSVFFTQVYGQGTIRGTVFDELSGETVPFATVFVQETAGGTTSDLDGTYSLSLDPGMYTITYSFIGYTDLNVSDVEVKEGDVTLLNIQMKEASEMLDEIVVTAKTIRNTEAAVLTIQKKSANLLDGISSQTFRKIGDSNAAGAIKRVTGVSVQGGKYVFVRGLGDRYTKSILNGMDVPGLDPDRNTLQLDIFPTNIIDNILVMKSFTPDLPGDFTGGVVDIITKDFPEEKSTSFSLGYGFNPSMHLKSDALGYNGSPTDFLGFDDGSRNRPFPRNTVIPATSDRDPRLTQLTGFFDNNWAPQQKTQLGNFNGGFSHGNQVNKDDVTIGYNVALNYRQNNTFYDDVQFNEFIKADASEVFDLEVNKTRQGQLGTNNVLLSGLVGGAIKVKNHKFSVNLIHLQNGERRAGNFLQETIENNSNTILRDNLEYTEKSITNVLVKGKHSFQEGGLELEWKLSPTFSKITDKDVRLAQFRLDDGEYNIEPSEGAIPSRLWRNLDEVNYTGRVDLTKKFSFKGRDSKLKFGLSGAYKERDYSILAYRFSAIGSSLLGFSGDSNEILLTENLWTPESKIGVYVVGNFEPANTYNATQQTYAAYAMNELPVTDKFKAVYGVRVENFIHNYTGQNNLGTVVFDDEEVLNNLDILPAVNLIYSLNEDMNLRASFSHTVARPSFKELSIAQIFDAVSDRVFVGNLDLKTSDITNYDLRWEYYQPGGQLLAVSAFYKSFKNPIELIAFSEQAPNSVTPRNVGDATVRGIELEVRKNLNFGKEETSPFSLGTNITIVDSKVTLDQSVGGEFESKVRTARDGEVISTTRSMQGQSPYIINTYFNYADREMGIEGNVSYNVQGKRLAIVGIGENPDVFEVPFHSLNLKASKTFGVDQRARVSLSANNILGSERIQEYQAFQASEAIFQKLDPGTSFSLGFSYRL